MTKRNRLNIGQLVASTNNRTNIMAKRLEVEIKYRTTGLYNTIVSQETIGIRKFAY